MSKRITLVTFGVVALSLFSFAQDDEKENSTLTKQKEEWRKALTELARVEKAAMMFDIQIELAAPVPWKTCFGSEGFRLLGKAYERRWQTVEGVQVFTRSGHPFGGEKEPISKRVLEWLKNLSPSELEALKNGEMTLGYLDSAFASNLRSFAATDGPMVKVVTRARG
jgi:hypothetical protein